MISNRKIILLSKVLMNLRSVTIIQRDNWLRLGRVLQRNGQKQEALLALQRSLKINRNNLEAARIIKELYEESGKKRLAEGMDRKIRHMNKLHQSA